MSLELALVHCALPFLVLRVIRIDWRSVDVSNDPVAEQIRRKGWQLVAPRPLLRKNVAHAPREDVGVAGDCAVRCSIPPAVQICAISPSGIRLEVVKQLEQLLPGGACMTFRRVHATGGGCSPTETVPGRQRPADSSPQR